jgi:LPS-assembly lipoprotein
MFGTRRNEMASWMGSRPVRGTTHALLLAAIAAVLAGCGDAGFRPMYGSAGIGGAATEQKLAQVDISTIPGRVGQQVRNEFIYQSTGGGAQLDPAYRLEVAIRESVSSTLVQSDGDSRSQIYNLDASFKLVRLADKQVVMQGKSYSRAAFERFQSIFSNVRARQDAEDRAAKTVGEDLKNRVAAYLASTA